jgi:hypothetical protein
MDHYEKALLAKRLAGNRMFIDTWAAYILRISTMSKKRGAS